MTSQERYNVAKPPGLWQRIKNNIGAHLRRYLIAGSLLLLPVALTYFILRFVFDIVDGVLGPSIAWLLEKFGVTWTLPGVGVAAAVLLIYVAGFVFANTIGRRLIAWGRKAVLRVPVIGVVYSATQKLMDSFSGSSTTGFRRVVMIQYPRQGLWTLGFLTGISTMFKEPYAVVYIPTAPTPTSGWVAILLIEEVLDTDISVPTAMQFVFSGGIVTPENIKTWPLSDSYAKGELSNIVKPSSTPAPGP